MNIGTTNIERKTSSGIKGVSLNTLSLYSQNTLDTHGKTLGRKENLAMSKSLLDISNYS